MRIANRDMAKPKINYHKLTIRPYPGSFTLVIGQKSEFEKYLDYYFKDYDNELLKDGCYLFRTDREKNFFRYVWMSELDMSEEKLGLLAHECLHATIEILHEAGLILSKDSAEAYTYLLQWIMIQIIGKINKL